MEIFWENFKLKVTLLRIWFMKNIMLFIKASLVVILLFSFTGIIKDSTPILGPVFCPLVGGLYDAIASRQGKAILSVFGVLLSIVSTIGIFTSKVKKIAIEDIKSSKLKLALVKAGLYFDSTGKLVKKTEEKHEVVDENIDAAFDNQNIFIGGKRAADEFITVITAQVDPNYVEEETEVAEEIKEEAEVSDNNEEITTEDLIKIEEGREEFKEDLQDAVDSVKSLNMEIAEAKADDGKISDEEHRSIVKRFGDMLSAIGRAIKNGFKKFGIGVCSFMKKAGRKIFGKKKAKEVVEGTQEVLKETEVAVEAKSESTQAAVVKEKITSTKSVAPVAKSTSTQSIMDRIKSKKK